MPAITPDLLERTRGTLLGAAIGDAFGMALEGAPRQHVNAQVRELRRGRLPAGHFTDETGAALTVAENLLLPEPADPAELARLLPSRPKQRRTQASTQRSGLLRRPAGTTPSQPAPAPIESGEVEPGLLTRCLPFALAFVGDRNECLGRTRSLSRVTYTHPDCVGGAGFMAVMLWHVMRGAALRQAVRQSLQACGDLPEPLAEKLGRASTRMRDHLTNGESVASCLESVVWGLINTASFAEALTRVTNLGGHAAAAGCLVGALAGATYRHSGIPADWRTQVYGLWPSRGGRIWREKELVELSTRLVQGPGRQDEAT